MTIRPDDDGLAYRSGVQLFALSFLALFLELLLIRWVPSAVRLVAYYANLMLISSFLGLGLGALISRRGLRLFRLFPLALVVNVGFIFLSRLALLPGSTTEYRFFNATPTVMNYTVLVGIFALNVIIFVPLGERIGQLFNALPALRAYAWDLGGSLCGTLAFGAFSLLAFSPFWGMVAVAALFLALSRARLLIWTLGGFAAALTLVFVVTDHRALWSPYYYITAHHPDGSILDVSETPGPLRTMTDPPIYEVRVNQDFYQPHGTMNPARFSPESAEARRAAETRGQYFLPYVIKPDPRRVVVVGAGGGQDVEAALLNGVERVDAVEIDPGLVSLARRLSASGVYDDPRVRVVVDDARAFLQRTEEKYDLIVFGYLDSQALFSSMSSIRLDGYVYTVESIRTAYGRLTDDGVLSLSFFTGANVWLLDKLLRTVREATGVRPISYAYRGGQITLFSFKNQPSQVPEESGEWKRFTGDPPDGPIPTDDWPYLYLSEKTVPSDYLVVIGILLALSIVAVLGLMPRGAGIGEGHFFFLGVGFLLLQTRSIATCSLYFGTTWMVTTVIVAGVLLMVLMANYVVLRHLTRFSRALYIPLMISLGVVYLVPTDLILSFPLAGRVAWSLLAVPLPIFFAGLIFSTTFRTSPGPSASLGANLIGATIGGFLEYAGMAIGHQGLGLFVMAAYLASLVVVGRRAGAGR
ncbi:MAG: hypothetical protein O7H41_07980 [Planctomycetota bacterium]|nr:hypothetical protein [Planctomycetota bacterium]